MWSADAEYACWLGVLAVGGLLVGLLVMDQTRLVTLFRFYLGFISVLPQCDLSLYLSGISV